MLILSLVVVGIFLTSPSGGFVPKVDIPTVVVIIANPGASPEEIETKSPSAWKTRSIPLAG
jgi:multidrug efflux pump subunit AcrB